MPLLKGRSKKTQRQNQRELERSKPSRSRLKGIRTLAARKHMSMAQAKHYQAAVIARAKARKS